MLANFSGFESERILSLEPSLEKEKEDCIYSIRGGGGGREIRKFNVAAVVYVYSNNPQQHSHHVDIRAFLQGGGEPQVVEVTYLSI